jgi:hypothetical protein
MEEVSRALVLMVGFCTRRGLIGCAHASAQLRPGSASPGGCTDTWTGYDGNSD